MERGRGIGDPLQIDELRGHNGYVDRIGSGLTRGDVIRMLFRRMGALLVLTFGLMMVLFAPFGIMDPWMFVMVMIMMLAVFLFAVVMIGIAFLCGGRTISKNLIENNYLLLLKDRIVIQSQADSMMLVVRNEVPLSKVRSVEPAGIEYREQRKRRTNWCNRIVLGAYDVPVAGLHPLASRDEYLMVIHLRSPVEIRCSGRIGQGVVHLGDKREYVKEIVVSVDPAKQGSLIESLGQMHR